MTEPSESPTVVLLHGLLCDASVWTHQVGALTVAGYPVVVPSLRGFDSFDAMADAALATADGPLVVVGHSMGGRVAFEIMRRAPQRVVALCVLDTGVHPVGDGEPAKRQRLVDRARADGIEAMAAEWLPPMVHPDRHRDPVMAEMMAMVTAYDLADYEGQIRALLGRSDAAPVLPTIAVPTLVIVGRDDAWSTPAQHEAFVSLIPDADLDVVADAGHMVTVEQPEVVSALLVDWLSEVFS